MTALNISPAFAENASTHHAEHHADGPQPLLREIPPGRPYPVHALGPLRASVEAVQGQTLASVAIPTASSLAVASLAVMGHADVETLGGPRPTALYVLTIAASGERKSSFAAPLMTGVAYS